MLSICFPSSVLEDFKALNCFSVCFSNAFTKEGYVNLACSIICLRLGCIFSPIQYSYLTILSYDKSDVFAVSLLTLNCGFASLILSSIAVISFYVLSNRLFLKCKGLS